MATRSACMLGVIEGLKKSGKDDKYIRKMESELQTVMERFESTAKKNEWDSKTISKELGNLLNKRRFNVEKGAMEAFTNMTKELEAGKLVKANVKKGVSAYKTIEDLLWTTSRVNEGIGNIEHAKTAYINTARQKLDSVVQEHKLKKLIEQDSDEFNRQLDKVLAGDKDATTNPGIVALAKAIEDVEANFVREGNLHGNIRRYSKKSGKVQESWYELHRRGYDEWEADMLAGRDWKKAGVASLARKKKILREMWEVKKNKASDEWATPGDRTDLNAPPKYDDGKRTLDFIDGDAKYNYRTKYGNGSVLDSLNSDITSEAGRIATTKILGTEANDVITRLAKDNGLTSGEARKLNDIVKVHKYGYPDDSPLMNFEQRLTKIDEEAGTGPKRIVTKPMKLIEDVIDSPGVYLKESGDSIRRLAAGSMLHRAAVWAIGDFSIAAAGQAGMTDRNFATTLLGTVKDFIATIKPENYKALRAEISHTVRPIMKSVAISNDKVGMMVNKGPATRVTSFPGKVVDTFLKWGGLALQSEHIRDNISMRGLQALASYIDPKKGLSDMPSGLQKLLKNVGLKDVDAKLMPHLEKDFKGRKIISADQLDSVSDSVLKDIYGDLSAREIALKRSDIKSSLNMYALKLHKGSPMPTMKLTHGLNMRNEYEIGTQLLKFIYQFRNFPVAVYGSMAQNFNVGGLKTVGNTLIGTTAMVLPIIMLDHMLKGKEVDLEDPQLYLQAVLRGGGLGLVGDIMLNEYTSSFRDFADITEAPALSKFGNPLAWHLSNALFNQDVDSSRLINDFFNMSPKVPFVGGYINESISIGLHNALGIQDKMKKKRKKDMILQNLY